MMKRVVLTILSICLVLAAHAQDKAFAPLTTWPYVYEDFSQGWITTTKGDKINYDKINVNLANGRVHYIQGDVIMEASISAIALLTIGEDSYVCASGAMVSVLKHTLSGAVVKKTEVDYDKLSRANIGYGTSAIASTQGLSIAALSASMDYSINKSMETVSTEKYSGEKLPLVSTLGIWYRGIFYPNTRADILGIPGVDKDAVKSYLKAEGIKLNNVDDLGKLVDYLYTL